MTDITHIDTAQGRHIAVSHTQGAGPTVVFLGGFRSNMDGTKALHLQAWAKRQGQAFLRFDYSGHGQSSGDFLDGCIGDWAEDACEAIAQTTTGPVVLVGSSMGGWIALLLARQMSERIAGLVGIAAAPDFTEDSMWAAFDETHRATLESKGQLELPSDYSDDSYIITRRLIEDGRTHLVLRTNLTLSFPTRFLQGTADADVEPSVALRLLQHATGDDIRLTLVKDADHRFSNSDNLALITRSVEDVISTIDVKNR